MSFKLKDAISFLYSFSLCIDKNFTNIFLNKVNNYEKI